MAWEIKEKGMALVQSISLRKVHLSLLTMTTEPRVCNASAFGNGLQIRPVPLLTPKFLRINWPIPAVCDSEV